MRSKARHTVEQGVAAFLRANPRAFCDDCLARLLRLGFGRNRTMARNATAALGEAADFQRHLGECSECGKRKKVIRTLSG